MAVGFSESYIRLWSLKGEKLRALRNDFSEKNIKDSKSHFFPVVLFTRTIQAPHSKRSGRKRPVQRAN
jgi:hypothetical protein